MNNKRELIIEKSAELFHHFGYHNTGINHILKELAIPKGSFYNYFESKEQLAVDVVLWHLDQTRKIWNHALANEYSAKSICQFFEVFFGRMEQMNYQNGCPIGNLITELADLNEPIRHALLQWMKFLEDEISKVLQQYTLEESSDPTSLASFIISAFEGAIMKAKVEQNNKALEHFKIYINNHLLSRYL